MEDNVKVKDWVQSESVRHCSRCGAEMDNRLRGICYAHPGRQIPLCWLCLDQQLTRFDTIAEAPTHLIDTLIGINKKFGATFGKRLVNGKEPYLAKNMLDVPRESLATDRLR